MDLNVCAYELMFNWIFSNGNVCVCLWIKHTEVYTCRTNWANGSGSVAAKRERETVHTNLSCAGRNLTLTHVESVNLLLLLLLFFVHFRRFIYESIVLCASYHRKATKTFHFSSSVFFNCWEKEEAIFRVFLFCCCMNWFYF